MATALELTRPSFRTALETNPPTNNAFIIRRGLPIPTCHPPGRAARYPFAGMTIGDCFDVFVASEQSRKGEPLTPITVQSRLATAARSYARKSGGKFVTRQIPTEGVVRIWRVA